MSPQKSTSPSACSIGLPISRTMISASASRRSMWKSATFLTSAARSATVVFCAQVRWASSACPIAASRSPSEISGYSLTVSPVAGLMTAYLPILLRPHAVAWRISLMPGVPGYPLRTEANTSKDLSMYAVEALRPRSSDVMMNRGRELGAEQRPELARLGDQGAVGRPELAVLLEEAVADERVRKRPSSSESGSGSGARKWTVRSIVGAGASSASRGQGAGNQASASSATAGASSGRSSRSPSQPPTSPDRRR